MSAKGVRKERGLPDGGNVRDYLTKEKRAALRLIEINLEETLRVIEFGRSSDVNRHIKAAAVDPAVVGGWCGSESVIRLISFVFPPLRESL